MTGSPTRSRIELPGCPPYHWQPRINGFHHPEKLLEPNNEDEDASVAA
jgi:hypothetical protein